MALALGTGPFAPDLQGFLNFDRGAAAPAHQLYLHEVPKRLRAVVAGETVADTRRPRLLHETGLMPVWYLPREDVRTDLLTPSPTRTTCPFKGEASYWSLQLDGREEPDLVWAYEDPKPGAPPLAGLVAFWHDRVEEWWEEDDRVIGHPRDPFHRIDTRGSSRHVQVRLGDEVVAESRRPTGLFETGLPARWYLPRDDVRLELLSPSSTTSVCPYKGVASYWSLQVGDRQVPDALWTYGDPFTDALPVAGMLCATTDDETGLRVLVDGQPA